MNSDLGYWEGRKEKLLSQMERDEARLNQKLAKVYEREAAALEKEIAAYYQRFGEKSVIEYRRLMQALSPQDRDMLLQRMEAFAKKYPQYAHLMPVRETVYRLNELEALQTQIRIQQLEIGAIEQGELQAHFERQARLSANLAAEQLGLGKQFYSLNAPIIEATVGAAWAGGKSFSERIWDNREKLAGYLNTDFAQAIARGMSYEQCARELLDRFERVSKKDAMRLIYTEGTFLFNEAQGQVHLSEGFDRYALSCVNDNKVCPICLAIQAEQQRKPALLSDRSPGVNFPPLHPWCRCSYTVEVADWDAWIDRYVEDHGGDAATRGRP